MKANMLENLIKESLHGEDVQLQLIGSRFFGWETAESDYDFLLLLPESTCSDTMEMLITNKLGAVFQLPPESTYSGMPFHHYRSTFGAYHVDFLLTTDFPQYSGLVAEHRRLKERCKKYPILNRLARDMKFSPDFKVKGSARYRIIRELSLYMESVSEDLEVCGARLWAAELKLQEYESKEAVTNV